MVDPGPQDVTADDSDRSFSISYGPSSDPWTRFGRSISYLDGYIHASNQSSATISFSFFGQILWYYSDLDKNRGSFTISVDSQPAIQLSAFSNSHADVTALYNTRLDPGPHTVVLTNTEQGKYMGLDYFMFRPLETSNLASDDIIVQANDSSVLYQPPDEWSPPSILPTGGGVTYKQTFKQGASATFSFTGDYFWYYSDKSNTNGAFQVAVDDETPRLYSARDRQPTDVQALVNLPLSPGRHSITITNMEDGSGTGLGYFAYHPLAGSAPVSDSLSPSSPSSSLPVVPSQLPENAQGPRSGLSVGAIVGIVLGLSAVVIFLLLLTFLFLHRRKRRSQFQDTITEIEPPSIIYRSSQMQPVGLLGAARDSYAPSSALPEYSESEPESRARPPQPDPPTKHVYSPGGVVV